MDEKVFALLLNIQDGMKDMQSDIKEIKSRLDGIEGTVNRIEASQNQDVIGMLKVTEKKAERAIEYMTHRITDMDMRIFSIEKRIQI